MSNRTSLDRKPRTSLDEQRPRLSLDLIRPSFDFMRRNSDQNPNGLKLLQLPRSLLTKILSYLSSTDFVNTYLVCVQFQIVTKEIVRARWKSVLPAALTARPTMIRSDSMKHLTEVGREHKPVGSEHLKQALSNSEWKKLASKFIPDSLFKRNSGTNLTTPVFHNPFTFEPRHVDYLEIPAFAGDLTAVTTSNPLPILIGGTSKGHILAYSLPFLKTQPQLDLVGSLETGFEDMKIVGGDGRIFSISKNSSLVSVFDIDTLKPVSTLGHKSDGKGYLTCLDYDPSTHLLVTGDHWGTVNLWDVRTPKHIFEGVSAYTHAVSEVHVKGEYVLAINEFATLYHLPKSTPLMKEGNNDCVYTSGVLSEDKKYFIGSTSRGSVTKFSFETHETSTVPYGNTPVTHLSLFNDLLFLSDTTGSTYLYEVPTTKYLGWRIKPLPMLNHIPYKCSTYIHPAFLASYSGNRLKVWNYLFEEDSCHLSDVFQYASTTQRCLIQ